MAQQKLYAQFVWEDVLQNKIRRTAEVPNHESAVFAGVKHNATYFTTYLAEAPDDAKADKGPRAYLLTGESALQTAADVARYLEGNKDIPHVSRFEADFLPRMFGRVSRDTSLQESFSAAAHRPSVEEKYDALLDLLRRDAPDQPYLTPNSAGFIRIEACDEVYGRDLKRQYPRAAR
ncbi:MAG: hypothetical protein H3C49_02950 [Alphaproteobacteria bacterium]|nr:hypothetical protein [Alphaproteobacteria bacterium]